MQHERPASLGPTLAVAVVAALITMAVFWPAARGGFVWDDGGLITKRHDTLDEWADTIAAFGRAATAGEGVLYYRPIMVATFVVDSRLANDFEAPTFHRTNVLLHGVNAALVAVLLAGYGCGLWAIGIAALLFGLHPLQCQAVALILGRNDLLLIPPVVLMLLADEVIRRRGRPWLADGLVVLGYTLTLWTKETGIVSPLFLLAIDLLWRQRPLRDTLRARLPLFAALGVVTALYFATRIAVLGAALDSGVYGYVAPLARIPLAIAILGYYVRHVVLPWGAAPAPYHPGLVDPSRPDLWIAAAFVVVFTLVTVISVRRAPRVATGLIVFAVALLPVLALAASMKVLILDHRTYLPMLGIAIAAGALHTPTGRLAGPVAAAAVLAALATLTAARVPLYADGLSLWALSVETAPESDYARNNYAAALMEAARYEEAVVQLREAIRLNPTYDRARFNLAGCLEYLGDRPQALRELESIAEHRPDDVSVLTRLGLMRSRGGDLVGATDAFTRLVTLKPDDAASRRNLADTLDRRGESAGAVPHRRRLVELEPTNATAWAALARSLAAAHQPADAIAAFERALAIGPETGNLQAELARELYTIGRWSDAAARVQRSRALGVVDQPLIDRLVEAGVLER